jgi:putative ABC transport system permease protein
MLTYELFQAISVAITVLSLLGFLIASIGLLGNATFITNIRQKEVGIRKVMGASSGRLLRMLLLDFAKPIIIANALAIPVGYLVGNAYISLFAARAELTVFPFIISLILSVLIAVAAVLSQSWKSAKVRPAMVLRYE